MTLLTEINNKLDKLRVDWKEGKRDRFAIELEAKVLKLAKYLYIRKHGMI